MIVTFRADTWRDYLAWQREDAKMLERLNPLIAEAMRDPVRGTGKPEPLKATLAGWWSRRIKSEHRLVYRVPGSREGQAVC